MVNDGAKMLGNLDSSTDDRCLGTSLPAVEEASKELWPLLTLLAASCHDVLESSSLEVMPTLAIREDACILNHDSRRK
jgi:hypothetical protein